MWGPKVASLLPLALGVWLVVSCTWPPPTPTRPCEPACVSDEHDDGCRQGLTAGTAQDFADLAKQGPPPSTSLLRKRDGGSELIVYSADSKRACALRCAADALIVPDGSGGYSCKGSRSAGLGLHASAQTADTPLFGVTLLLPIDLRSALETASAGILGRPGKALQAGNVIGVWADDSNQSAKLDALK